MTGAAPQCACERLGLPPEKRCGRCDIVMNERETMLAEAWARAEDKLTAALARVKELEELMQMARLWKRLAKRQRANAFQNHFAQALADGREIVSLRVQNEQLQRTLDAMERRYAAISGVRLYIQPERRQDGSSPSSDGPARDDDPDPASRAGCDTE